MCRICSITLQILQASIFNFFKLKFIYRKSKKPYNYWLFLTMSQPQKSATLALSILLLDIMQCFSSVNYTRMDLKYCGSNLLYTLLKIQIRNYNMRNVRISQYLSLQYFRKFTCNLGKMMS